MSQLRSWSMVAALLAPLAAGPVPALAAGMLPPDVLSAIRKDYVFEGMQTRYLDAQADLDGDGKDEWLVYVVGSAACGSGGCPTLVFAPTDSGYRLVSTIGLTRPPIRVAKGTSKGWQNLIVHVSGGGQKGRDVELLFDGRRYPPNPSVRGSHIKRATTPGTTLVADFKSFAEAKALP